MSSKRRFVIFVDREIDDDIYPIMEDWCSHSQLSARVIEAIRYYLGAQLSPDEIEQLRGLLAGMQGAGSSVLPRERKLVSRGLPEGTRPIQTLEDLDKFIEEHGLDE